MRDWTQPMQYELHLQRPLLSSNLVGIFMPRQASTKLHECHMHWASLGADRSHCISHQLLLKKSDARQSMAKLRVQAGPRIPGGAKMRQGHVAARAVRNLVLPGRVLDSTTTKDVCQCPPEIP